jgi:hypothetical protein
MSSSSRTVMDTSNSWHIVSYSGCWLCSGLVTLMPDVTDYSNTENNREKEFCYLSRTALEYVGPIFGDINMAMKNVDKATSKGANSNDMAALLGIIQKIREKIKFVSIAAVLVDFLMGDY